MRAGGACSERRQRVALHAVLSHRGLRPRHTCCAEPTAMTTPAHVPHRPGHAGVSLLQAFCGLLLTLKDLATVFEAPNISYRSVSSLLSALSRVPVSRST